MSVAYTYSLTRLLPAYQSLRTKRTERLQALQMKVGTHSWGLSLWNSKGMDLLLYNMFVVSSLSDSTVHSFIHCTEGVWVLLLVKSKPLMEVAECSTKHCIWLTEYTGFSCLSHQRPPPLMYRLFSVWVLREIMDFSTISWLFFYYPTWKLLLNIVW